MYCVSGVEEGRDCFLCLRIAQVWWYRMFNFDASLHIMRPIRIAGVRIPVTGPKPPNSDQAPSRCRDPQSISTTPSQTSSILSPLPNRTRSLSLGQTPLDPPPPSFNANPSQTPQADFPSAVSRLGSLSRALLPPRSRRLLSIPLNRPALPSAVPAVLCHSLDRPTETSTRPNGEHTRIPVHGRHNLQHAAWINTIPLRKQRRASLQPCRPVSSVPNVDQVWFCPIREPPRPFPIAPAASLLVRSYGTLTGPIFKTKAALVLLEGRKTK